MTDESVTLSPLGKKTSYIANYTRDLLYAIPRKLNRDEIAVPTALPFKGVDIWNGYELSWLNAKGKPVVALAEFIFPCESPNIIESKSFKLYLNSFTNSQFATVEEVTKLMQRDLSDYAGAEVTVKVTLPADFSANTLATLSGVCLDDLDVQCEKYTVAPEYLQTSNESVTENLFTDLLKSNCLVTGQPDWASLQIQYTGKKIQHEGLLKYIVSLRNHNEFHEQCVERIFMDILRICKPEKLMVYARYTRRGGLDINPFRSTDDVFPKETGRLCRQ